MLDYSVNTPVAPPRRWWQVDPWISVLVVALLLLSLLMLYSIGGGMALVQAQGLRILMGALVVFVILVMPVKWLIHLSPVAYVGFLALLVLVLFVGASAGGAQRWINLGPIRLQPSEFGKVVMVMIIAWWFSFKPRHPNLLDVLLSLALIALPVLLIREEPDLGTAILVALSGLVTLFLAGLSWWVIAAGGVAAAFGVPLFWAFGIADYQKERVLTLFNPEVDPWGAGYHIIQSKIAIGSGGVSGKGFMQGTQSQLEFLPESDTDFIFAVLAEEWGLFGVAVLLILYTALILRGLWLSTQLSHRYARMVCGAIFFILFVNVFINIGMVSGFLPVVGLPLLFISFGGSAMLTFLAGMGLALALGRSYMRQVEGGRL
ncbi:rod shape-determining protein RodA [Suttonella sp. R2A3]|uniref:rod shape-determining protein RodA n=1 Tax=Suttonella sp. R2A3 TaxID=2908648 RepID=UPI001F1899E2|nr:rod shape-determining protein RodA [Suttonella sp. R2A3]UJF24294.1 rod shape-determining protein RodA [Suttonella sp. R2A3]